MEVEEFIRERLREAEEYRQREETLRKWEERLALAAMVALTTFVLIVLPILEAVR